MKYLLGAIALALTAPVFAQSSVTLYGIVDVGGEYLSGHSKDVRVVSGGLNSSRIGFKGSEDLGNGARAEFVLEGGLNIDEGGSAQGGALFGRQAFGALKTTAGTFSAGRQYSSIYAITNEFSAFGNTSVGATTAIIGGFAGGYEPVRGSSATATEPATGTSQNGGPARVNNSFRYTSPDLSGFKVSGLYGAGEVTGGTRQTRLWDGSLRYTGYGIDAAVSYVNDKAAAPVAANSADVNTLTGAVSYYFLDAFHIEGGYLKVDDRRAADLDGHGFWVGGDYRLGANLFKLQFVQNRAKTGQDNKTNVFGAGYQYDFSKRTALYTTLTRFQNGDGTGLGRYNSALPVGLTLTTDNDITEFALGVRHMF